MAGQKEFQLGDVLQGVVQKFFHKRGFGFLLVEGYKGTIFFHVEQWKIPPAEPMVIKDLHRQNKAEATRFSFVVGMGLKGLEAQQLRKER